MKKNFYLLSFSLIAILVSSCFSPWRGNEGSLSIVWGSASNSRAVHREDLQYISVYRVILNGPGGTMEEEFTGIPGASFSLVPGTWNVMVKGGYYQSITGSASLYLQIIGMTQIEIRAGEKSTAKIMMYDAAEVDSWTNLNTAALTGNGPLCTTPGCPQYGDYHEQIILLKQGIYEANYATVSTINVTWPIILVAEEKVTVKRVGTTTSNFFNLSSGSGTNAKLTLGQPGMTGTITLDGDNTGISSAIYLSGLGVSDIGKLIMNDGVTIRNNNGGGVTVGSYAAFEMIGGTIASNNGSGVTVWTDGSFEMNGGLISNNTSSNGGGVNVQQGGIFRMMGGTISGNTATAGDGGGVYVDPAAATGSFTREGGTIRSNIPENVEAPGW